VKPDRISDEVAILDQRRTPLRFIEKPDQVALIVIVTLRLRPSADKRFAQRVCIIAC
jgi:hypothetical protein